MSRIEPGAIGSIAVLMVALIGGLGFGGWTVLQEVQKVQFAPVEQTPACRVRGLDPLAGVSHPIGGQIDSIAPNSIRRHQKHWTGLYRPQALEVPILGCARRPDFDAESR